MSYDEDEGFGGDFKINSFDEEGDEPIEIPEEIDTDFLDEEDPDRDG